MQGRSVGTGKSGVAAKGAAKVRHFGKGTHGAIAAHAPVGASHGSKPALVRSILTVTFLAGSISAALIGSGVDLSKIGLPQAVTTAEASTEIRMPRPNLHLVALSDELEKATLRASASFAPSTISTPTSVRAAWTASPTITFCRNPPAATRTTSSNSGR